MVGKAYSAAYAAFRIAESIASVSLKNALEGKAVNLLVCSLDEDNTGRDSAIRDLEYLFGFGRDLGLINTETAEIAFSELSAIRQFGNNPAIAEPINKEHLIPRIHEEHRSAESRPSEEIKKPAEESVESAPEVNLERKVKIMDRIRQSGNCRIKDIQEVLPSVSERSVRYYLQGLVQEGLIERVGQSGPSTYYRLKTTPGEASEGVQGP